MTRMASHSNSPGFGGMLELSMTASGHHQIPAILLNEFRNTRIAHQEKPLTDAKEARAALSVWVETLAGL